MEYLITWEEEYITEMEPQIKLKEKFTIEAKEMNNVFQNRLCGKEYIPFVFAFG